MRIWTAHEKSHASPILVREGFSFGALIFGPIWLAVHRCWLAAFAVFLLMILIRLLAHAPASGILIAGLALLTGFSARDLMRWSVTRRGYLESGIVAARTEDEALARLLSERPELMERSMVVEAAP